METAFIKKTIEELLSALSADAQLDAVSELEGVAIVRFSIKTSDPRSLLGEEGKTLMALNHVVKKIAEQQSIRENIKPISFLIDVNDYQEKKIQELKTRAHMMAERARFFKSSVELIPMNPYERMIIHSFFSNTPDIKAESMGEWRDRRVVIKFIEQST